MLLHRHSLHLSLVSNQLVSLGAGHHHLLFSLSATTPLQIAKLNAEIFLFLTPSPGNGLFPALDPTLNMQNPRTVLRSVLSVDFPFIALKNEDALVSVRPRPESHCFFIPRSEIFLHKNEDGILNNADADHGNAKQSSLSSMIDSVDTRSFQVPQPVDISDLTSHSKNAVPCILPDMGRLYCNILFDFLERKDTIVYDWICPAGEKFHSRSYLKVLGQQKTWSWTYIDISEKRARKKPGKWSVEIRVNDQSVGRVFFELLHDVIETKDKGVLPIILSCPQGHSEAINLTKILGSHLHSMFGCFPTIVVSKLDPRILDLDVAGEVVDPELAPYHTSYYQIIRSNIKRILTLQRRIPLLVNVKVHDDPSHVFHVGSLDGATLRPMQAAARRAGDPRFGEHGLVTKLRRWTVRPSHDGQPDEAGYAGGNLLRIFAAGGSEPCINGLDLFLPRELVC